MSKLAMNWDTLGWIKYQIGDVESAEKYVVALDFGRFAFGLALVVAP